MEIQNPNRDRLIDRIESLERECFEFPYTRDQIRSDVSRKESLYYVVMENGEADLYRTEPPNEDNPHTDDKNPRRNPSEALLYLLNNISHAFYRAFGRGGSAGDFFFTRADGTALNEDRIEGILGYAIVHLLADDRAELIRIAIAANGRRKGYSMKLLNRIITDLRWTGIESIFLEVSVLNQPAMNLYRKIGFSEIRKRKNYYPDGADALVMEFVL